MALACVAFGVFVEWLAPDRRIVGSGKFEKTFWLPLSQQAENRPQRGGLWDSGEQGLQRGDGQKERDATLRRRALSPQEQSEGVKKHADKKNKGKVGERVDC